MRGSGKGDQYFKVKVEVHKKLTEKQKSLLQEFAKEMGESNKDRPENVFWGKLRMLVRNKLENI